MVSAPALARHTDRPPAPHTANPAGLVRDRTQRTPLGRVGREGTVPGHWKFQESLPCPPPSPPCNSSTGLTFPVRLPHLARSTRAERRLCPQGGHSDQRSPAQQQVLGNPGEKSLTGRELTPRPLAVFPWVRPVGQGGREGGAHHAGFRPSRNFTRRALTLGPPHLNQWTQWGCEAP